MTVNRTALFILVAAGLVVLGFAPGTALAQSPEGATRAKARPSAQLRQNTARPARARTRIRVTRIPPVYPYRLESSVYPVPYTYEYPGPNAVRQCTAWLATEYRLSGTVVVPRTQCWWERP
jgi:hypothetical protein